MSKLAKKGCVPVLRFPEFREEGEWDTKKLGDLSEIVRGGSPRPIDEYITTDINGLNWLKIGDVNQDAKYVTFTKEKVLRTALSKTREVNPGDLIMSNSMSFGRPYILKIKSCIHDGWIAVTKINEQANRDYLYYLILSPASQEYFLNNAAGSGVQNLNADIIKLLPVLIPKYSEQQKISACLSSLDELITAQAQKVEALKTHKKGLMQQLFPAKGETVPKLRFPEFSGEWEYKILEDVTKEPISYGIVQAGLHIENGVPYIKSSDVGGIIDLKKLQCTSNEIHHKYRRSAVHPNDIVFSLRGNIGQMSIVPEEIKEANLTQGTARISVNNGNSTLFVYFQIMSDAVINRINKKGKGSTFQEISLGELRKISIMVASLAEQQKIAACLSSLDELITAQAQKLEALKTHKKGLMQQLFPAMDEIDI